MKSYNDGILAMFCLLLGSSALASETPSNLVCLAQAPRYSGGNFAVNLHLTDSGDAGYELNFMPTSHGMDAIQYLKIHSGNQKSAVSAHGLSLEIDYSLSDSGQSFQERLSIDLNEHHGFTPEGKPLDYLTGLESSSSDQFKNIEKIFCVEGTYRDIYNRYYGVFGFADRFIFDTD